jgi:hypothetical protein
MSTPSKGVITPDPIVLQKIVAATEAVYGSSILDVSSKFAAAIFWDFAPVATTATPVATLLQVLTDSSLISGTVNSPDDAWSVVQDWLSPTAVPATFANVTGTLGTSTFTVTSAAGLVTYGYHFIAGAAVNETDSEWVFPIKVSGNTVTIRGTLKNTYAGATLYSNAQKMRFDLDLSNIGKLKFMIGNNRPGTTRDVASRIRVESLNSIVA